MTYGEDKRTDRLNKANIFRKMMLTGSCCGPNEFQAELIVRTSW